MTYSGVIVEGADCSGKTTLVKRLKAALSTAGWDVHDMGHKPGDQFRRYADAYVRGHNLLLDRGHFSEVVYSRLWRGGSPFAPWERELLDDYVLGRYIVVLCTAPPVVLAARHAGRSYDQVTHASELEAVQRLFVQELSAVRPIYYESTNEHALNTIVRQLIDLLGQPGGEADILKSTVRPTERRLDFILLEGANGGGKSTLAKLLKVNLVGWAIKTLDYAPGTHPFNRFLAEYLSARSHILDRGHFSEIVYGDMFRHGVHFDQRDSNHLNAFLRARALTILCEASAATISNRIATSPYAKHINPDRIPEVQERFRAAIELGCVDHVTVRTDIPAEVEALVSDVHQRIGGRRYSDMGWDL